MTAEIDAINEIRASHEKMRKVMSVVFGISLATATPLLIFLPPETTSGIRSVLSVVAMFCILGLAFIGRVALIITKSIYKQKRPHRRLLDFTETDDFKMQPGDALYKIRQRQEEHLNRRLR